MLTEREKERSVWPVLVPIGLSLVLLAAAASSCRHGHLKSAVFACIVFQVLFFVGGLIVINFAFRKMVLRAHGKSGDSNAEGDTVHGRASKFAARTLPLEIVTLGLALAIYLTGGYLELVDKLFAPAYSLYIVSSTFFLLSLVIGIHRTFAKDLAELMRPSGPDPADSEGASDEPPAA